MNLGPLSSKTFIRESDLKQVVNALTLLIDILSLFEEGKEAYIRLNKIASPGKEEAIYLRGRIQDALNNLSDDSLFLDNLKELIEELEKERVFGNGTRVR